MGIREELREDHKIFFDKLPLKSGRLLDVGCGDGIFLKEAEKAGFDVWGIDLDKKSIEVCQKKWGLRNTFPMSLKEFATYAEERNLKFDVITFFGVLEHQDNPKEFLMLVRDLLKSRGIVIGSVPNRESWFMKIVYSKRFPNVYYPPHHFLLFSKSSLANLFSTCGFKECFIVSTPQKIRDITYCLNTLILGNNVMRKVKKILFGSELFGEGTLIYRQTSVTKKTIFKFLKLIRDFIFFFPAIIIRYTSQGMLFYFQFKNHE